MAGILPLSLIVSYQPQIRNNHVADQSSSHTPRAGA